MPEPETAAQGPHFSTNQRRSCTRCSQRKVRCSRTYPCDSCTKTGDQCIFPGPQRAPRKLNRPPVGELLARLQRLEEENKRLRSLQQAHDQPSPGPAGDSRFERGSASGARYPDVLNHPQSTQSPAPSPNVASCPFGGLLRLPSHHWSRDTFHVRYFQPGPINTLWRVYLHHVAPLIAIIHTASLDEIVRKASSGEKLDPPNEALLLSVCFAAVVSMTPEQCQSKLGQAHCVAIQDYRLAVEHALSEAYLLNSHETMALQAATLFLLCARVAGETRLVWTQTAVVIRLAQSQGIHTDGTGAGLTPFETEIRRRLWWHICILDMLCSEDQGTDMQIRPGMFDTRFPMNMDEEDMAPDMAHAYDGRGLTDITLCLITCYMIRETHWSKDSIDEDSTPLAVREEQIKTLGKQLNQRYLDYFALSIPIHWVVATIARLQLSKAWIAVHPQPPTAESFPTRSVERDFVFKTAVETIEFAYFLQNNEITAQWSWLCRSYKQRNVVSFILSEFCVRPASPQTERAWAIVNKMTSQWKRDSDASDDKLGRPLSELLGRIEILQAARRRESIFQQSLRPTEHRSPGTIGGLDAASHLEHHEDNGWERPPADNGPSDWLNEDTLYDWLDGIWP